MQGTTQLGSAGGAHSGDLPPGLLYIPHLITEIEERILLDRLHALPESSWETIRMRGVTARRTMLCYGRSYVSSTRRLVDASPLPDFILPVRDRCEAQVDLAPGSLEQVIVTRYPEGAGIGSHADAKCFGEVILSLSLRSHAVMVFERAGQPKQKVDLAPRSLLVITGEARWEWKHSIPGVKTLRYSVTMRTLAR